MRFMKNVKRPLIIGAIIATAIGLAACGTNTPTATAAAVSKPTITGTFTLIGTQDVVDPGTPDATPVDGDFTDLGSLGCAGIGGYNDIGAGLQVQVSDEDGTAIGTGELDLGEITNDGCRFPFTVQNLPVAKFYKITVGHRGELDYSYAELQAADWNVGFTLGS